MQDQPPAVSILAVITMFISAFLPSVSTFRALKEFLASYWVVFSLWHTLECAANVFSLIRLIPAYEWIKLCSFSWMFCYGHDFFFDALTPLIDDAEPLGANILRWTNAVNYPAMIKLLGALLHRLTLAILRMISSVGAETQHTDDQLRTAIEDTPPSMSSTKRRDRNRRNRPSSLRELHPSGNPSSDSSTSPTRTSRSMQSATTVAERGRRLIGQLTRRLFSTCKSNGRRSRWAARSDGRPLPKHF